MYRIAVVPGDGTGPEVIAEGLKVLDALGIATDRETYDLGAERYARTGETLPDGVLDELRKVDAIYFGAVGLPDKVPPGVLERGIILRLRFELDLYINLRPVKRYPGVPSPVDAPVDFVVVGENTEGLYTGTGGLFKKGTPDEVALQTSVNTRKGVERCVRYAYELASTRRKLTFVGKTNVLTYAHDLWQRVFEEVGRDYPSVEQDYKHVDAWCLLAMQRPDLFDVVVTDNLFRDIITDLAAVLQGGLGVAASGNINPDGVSMFEPVGGTAPEFTGQGVINPLAAIGALKLMLDHLGEKEAADRVEVAMAATFPRLKGMGAGEMGYSTSEVGDMVAGEI